MDDIDLINETAREFGFQKQLKKEQIECLEVLLKGRDVMGILPTGYGKSLIFQLAPFVLRKKGSVKNSVGLIVTPLNSIMLDQIRSMNRMGIKACSIDFSCSVGQSFEFVEDEDLDCESDVENETENGGLLTTVPISDIIGNFDLIYVHPEALLSCKAGQNFLRELEEKGVLSCIAIDEAHIILEWGTEFRKDFGRLGDNLLSRFPNVPVMVFTATASPAAQALLSKSLKLKNPHIISINPDRPNIKYSKILRPASSHTQDHLEQILDPIIDDLKTLQDGYPLTIIYTDTNIISFAYAYLEKKLGSKQYIGDNIPENRLFAQYHQNYTDKMKQFIVEEICKPSSKIRVVFATVALGMGLNAPQIRCVIHYKPPNSIEKYFQETGRAGRDGEPSHAIMYYNNTDIRLNRPGIDKNIIMYCKNETKCMRAVMLECFGFQPTPGIINCCDVCDNL